MTAAAVIHHARQMLGTPWRHQGRKPWAVDCAGLVILAFNAAGWPGAMQTPKRYGRDGWNGVLRESLEEYFGAPIARGAQWLPGDVPLFAFAGHQESHIGIFGDHPSARLSLIHASQRAGRVVEAAVSDALQVRIVDVYRPIWPT